MSLIIDQILQQSSSFKVGCINSPLKVVETDIIRIITRSIGEDWIKKEYQLHNLEQLKKVLDEPDSKSINFLLWTPALRQANYTVFLNNFTDGWITLLTSYSYKYNQEIASVRFSNINTDYPAFSLSYQKGAVSRTVQLLKDTYKWVFNVEGNPLAIEDPANYEKRKKTDRLNNDILENYMKRLGFDCTQKGFWVSAGNAIEYKFELGTD